MKGTIVCCLEELVRSHGADKWKEVLAKAGCADRFNFAPREDVPDALVLGLVNATAAVLKITPAQAMAAFGEHWATVYAPGIYGVYFDKCKSAREFLLSLAGIHVRMTASMANASPPAFTYDDSQADSLVMTYQSKRGLVALMPGLVQGVAKHYKEQVDVSVAGDKVTVRFRSAQSRKTKAA